jgi:hypothetical protein
MLCIEGYNRVFKKDVIYKIVAQISFFKKNNYIACHIFVNTPIKNKCVANINNIFRIRKNT